MSSRRDPGLASGRPSESESKAGADGSPGHLCPMPEGYGLYRPIRGLSGPGANWAGRHRLVAIREGGAAPFPGMRRPTRRRALGSVHNDVAPQPRAGCWSSVHGSHRIPSLRKQDGLVLFRPSLDGSRELVSFRLGTDASSDRLSHRCPGGRLSRSARGRPAGRCFGCAANPSVPQPCCGGSRAFFGTLVCYGGSSFR